MALSYLVGSLMLVMWFDCSVHLSHAVAPQGCDLDTTNNGNSQVCVNLKCPELAPRTCKDVKSDKPRVVVTLENGFEVLCDTQTDGGGWTVIQRRLNADVDFYRNWFQYKYGFGNISGNFWLGNEKIHQLTFLREYQLRVDITFNDTQRYATYSHFRLFGEPEKYQLDVTGYSGNAGDSLAEQNGMAFSTLDRDNDIYSSSCAVQFHGAWWYNSCHYSNLNGLYASKNYAEGITWYHTTGYYDSATASEMKIRPIN